MAKRKRKRKDRDEDDDQTPWSEERWEAFMRESDLRSARFGEILETVRDDPDRDRIIAREMGWTWLEEALDEEEAGRAAGKTSDEDSGEDDADDGADEDDDERDFNPQEIIGAAMEEVEREKAERAAAGEPEEDPFGDDDCDHIPAYRLAFDVGMKIHDALQPYMNKEVGEKDEDYDRRLGQAYIGCQIAAAKIAGGHAMGYEDDVLCGNIVNCKRGLAGAEDAERAFLELKEDGSLPAELVDALLLDVRAVIAAVRARIEELRGKVWW